MASSRFMASAPCWSMATDFAKAAPGSGRAVARALDVGVLEVVMGCSPVAVRVGIEVGIEVGSILV